MHHITQRLTQHYESCLAAHGPNAQGMDWGTNEQRLSVRFQAICRAMDLQAETPAQVGGREQCGKWGGLSILDAGCGCGLFYDHLQNHYPRQFDYIGLDASTAMIAAASERHPNARFIVGDILSADAPTCDWVVANGLITECRDTPESEMVAYAQRVIASMFALCRIGIVFNVMSSHVNYRNENLFYWDPSDVMRFAATHLSRHVALYHDLELYDYFCCIRREPWKGVSDHDR